MKIVARIVGGSLILLGVATAVNSFMEYGIYLYTPMEILGEYIVYVVLVLVGLLLIALSYGKIRMPSLPERYWQTVQRGFSRRSLKQKLILGASFVSVLMILYPPKQRISNNGSVLSEHYGWIFSSSYYSSKSVVNIPMLSLQLIVVFVIALALLYAFKDSK